MLTASNIILILQKNICNATKKSIELNILQYKINLLND